MGFGIFFEFGGGGGGGARYKKCRFRNGSVAISFASFAEIYSIFTSKSLNKSSSNICFANLFDDNDIDWV